MKRFDIVILETAREFLVSIEESARKKIVFNLKKAESLQDPKLFKKLTNEIWEFRTKFNRQQYRLLAFWDKRDNKNTLVICTNGFIKKTRKTPKKDINKAIEIMNKYYLTIK